MAALGSVGSAIVLLSLKIFLSHLTGSLGVLSEALHSSLDLIAAIITYLSVRVSDRPADADHTYGHGKVENFSAFVETGLLMLTAAYIIWEAVQRLFFRQVTIRPSLLAIGDSGHRPGNRSAAIAGARASRAGADERGARSGRAAFFDRRVEHVGGDCSAWRWSGWASEPA